MTLTLCTMRKLWRSRYEPGRCNTNNRKKYHRQTVKMLAVVVLAFAVCWLPFHIGRILFSSTAWTGTAKYRLYNIIQYFNLISMLLFYLSASINPILYNIMSQKYRAAVYKFLNLRPSLQHRNSSRRSEPTSPGHTEISSYV
nr:PREDICTED: growth hormone secretagogue receptor type 1-like [Latimeria chalumnae]|eukprot:XP_006008931.1 PREDICTED: growth hormone secretagogue receptor type 1-like [Latimeria chalumnae]